MKKTILSILLITTMCGLNAQVTDTLYLLNGDKLSDKNAYDYYFTLYPDTGNTNLFTVRKFYKSGNLKQQCTYLQGKEKITKANFIHLRNSKKISLVGRDITYYESGQKMIDRFYESRDKQSTNKFYLESGDSALIYAEKMPFFPGGMEELTRYLDNNINYPKDVSEEYKSGKVIVLFVVDKVGSVQNAIVVESLNPVLDEEALKAVRGLPQWIPGSQNGKPQNIVMTIPIKFRK